MGWFLWRKPYPGFSKEEQIDILKDEILVGRGKDCAVHCLSMYVSRRHLKLISKDGGVYVTDLGSSNGTFVNQTKITPNMEFPLKVGDEVGIGNFSNDSHDCFVYEVRHFEKIEESSTGHESIFPKLPVKEQPQNECQQVPTQEKIEEEEKQPVNIHSIPSQLGRGLKRCANEPEIVVLDDDGNDHGIMVESFSLSKRLKIDRAEDSPVGRATERSDDLIMESNSECPPVKPSLRDMERCVIPVIQEDKIVSTSSKDCSNAVADAASREDVFREEVFNIPEGGVKSFGKQATSIKADQIFEQCISSDIVSETKCNSMLPPSHAPIAVNANSKSSSVEGTLPKPLNQRVSSLLEGSCDSSSGTIKLASPVPTSSKGVSPSSFSTPIHSKLKSPEDVIPVLTSTPFIKIERNELPAPQSDAIWSPITKDSSSRYSQGSSANYTLDEEIIPIDLCDEEDDENFPCSQMFSDKDVKPCIQDLEKEANLVDLSGDEPERSNMEMDDDVILISSSDEGEDEDSIEDANRWFMRLSQSSVKVEEDKEVDNFNCHSNYLDHSAEKKQGKEAMQDNDGLWNGHQKDWDFDLELEGLQQVQASKTTVEEIDQGLCEESDQEQLIKKSQKHTHNKELEELEREQLSKRKLETAHEDESKELVAEEIEEELGKTCQEIPGTSKHSRETSKNIKLREKKDYKTEKKTDKKHKKKSEKSKERATESSSRKAETKSHRHRSSDRDRGERQCKHLSHYNKHHSRKRDSHVKNYNLVNRLRETFADNDSEGEESERLPPPNYKTSDMHNKEQARASKVSCSNKSDSEFDKLLMKSNERHDSKTVDQQILVTLDRLEDDPQLCERYGLSSSPSPSPPPPAPIQKKVVRKIELVDALPNPPRRAVNRGISLETAKKMFDTDKRKSIEGHKGNKSRHIDTLALRKEKLAEVAAKCSSKGKGSSDSKRAAPAKIKVTESNRGSFLTETDEPSPVNKPRSRKDILGNVKIPKLKDKPVTILPAKSPLQAMNMSWEKKSPPRHVAQSSTVKKVPVEIPTGPQPKKRIAQVPPPGFYDEAKFLAVPKSSIPIKSCLSGSSKHNIAMNDSKPIVPKKRVHFKEPIEEVFFIEKLPNTRPVSSSRDADRPKPMSQITSMKLPKGPIVPNDEALLQDVIYDISKWNPLWLKEEKDLPPDVAPPVVSNMVLPRLPKTEFLDFREYHETMYPLLMLELWNGVSREYNLRINDAKHNMVMAVDTASNTALVSKPERMLTTLSCHMVVDNRPNIDHPRLGSLVMIDLVLKDGSGKVVISPVFGYVSFDSKDRLRNSDQFHKDLVQYCHNPAFKIRFSIVIRERKNFAFAFERVMQIKHVKYVRGDLRMFQAMKNLEYTPLQYSVISPMAASEDFTLPDVTQKVLAFSEQLNPTQVRVVLQTAEACLQDKPKICLIQGPPGTGKTQVIESLVMHLLYRDGIYSRANRERGLVPRILLCAPSNNAVDLLVARLLRRRAKFEKEHRFKMVRVGQPQQEDVKGVSLQELANVAMKQDKAMNDSQMIEMEKGNWAAKLCAVENQIRDLKDYMKPIPPDLEFRLADFNRKLRVLTERQKEQNQAPATSSKHDFAFERETKKKILRGADIIATTLNSCVVKVMETVFPPTSQGKYNFTVCIVDEATQCLEVETLIPLLLVVKTLVLVGDPNQLPATILSKIAREKGLGTSLFARLQNIVPEAIQLLDTQYRMHPEILRWPNKFFYKCRLKTPEQMSICRKSRILPYTVFSLPFHQDPRGEANPDEARMVLELAELVIDEKVIQHDFRVGIVTPYQSQRRTFESLMERMPKRIKTLLEVNTIDSYQGQEKDIIILSCVRTNGVGFLSDRQRLNVALTRAKYALFICGNFSSLDRDSMWNNLLIDARQRNCFLDIRDRFCKKDLWNHICKK